MCSNGDDPSHIVYQDEKYSYVGTTNFFNVDVDNENDVLLSWNGYRYIGYIDEYYSSTSEYPLFIYNERVHKVYLHEDYNYLNDTFIIENTDDEIVFEKIFNSKTAGYSLTSPIKVLLTSKQCSRIKTYVEIEYNNQWYLTLPETDDVWVASDEFVKILLENEIIEN